MENLAQRNGRQEDDVRVTYVPQSVSHVFVCLHKDPIIHLYTNIPIEYMGDQGKQT